MKGLQWKKNITMKQRSIYRLGAKQYDPNPRMVYKTYSLDKY